MNMRQVAHTLAVFILCGKEANPVVLLAHAAITLYEIVDTNVTRSGNKAELLKPW